MLFALSGTPYTFTGSRFALVFIKKKSFISVITKITGIPLSFENCFCFFLRFPFFFKLNKVYYIKTHGNPVPKSISVIILSKIRL